jgi:hypothetical protein
MDADQTNQSASDADPQALEQVAQQDGQQGADAGVAAQSALIDAAADVQDDKPGLLQEIEDDVKRAVKFIKVRVLRLCEHGQPNDVVALAPRAAKAAEKAGHVDTSPEAVAYAESLKTPDAS